jgi:hypothetical protein
MGKIPGRVVAWWLAFGVSCSVGDNKVVPGAVMGGVWGLHCVMTGIIKFNLTANRIVQSTRKTPVVH